MLWDSEFLPGVGGFKGEVDESSDELDKDDEEEEDEDKVSAFFFFFFFFFFLLWLCLDVSSGIISLLSWLLALGFCLGDNSSRHLGLVPLTGIDIGPTFPVVPKDCFPVLGIASSPVPVATIGALGSGLLIAFCRHTS